MYTIHSIQCERSTLSHFLRRNSCHRLSHTEWWCMMYCPTCNVNWALPQSWGGACSRPTRHTALWLSQVLLSCSQHLPDWILAWKDIFCTQRNFERSWRQEFGLPMQCVALMPHCFFLQISSFTTCECPDAGLSLPGGTGKTKTISSLILACVANGCLTPLRFCYLPPWITSVIHCFILGLAGMDLQSLHDQWLKASEWLHFQYGRTRTSCT